MITKDPNYPFTSDGYPDYPIRGCRWKGTCAYPYCSCPVEHDRYDRPQRSGGWGAWNWPVIADLVVIMIILLGTLFVTAGLPWQW